MSDVLTPLQVYLCGPMRGHPDMNRSAFLSAAARLREQGYEVRCPAEPDREAGFDPTDDRPALAHVLAWIARSADVVVALPGWTASRGALAEIATAQAVGIPVHELEAFLSVGRAAPQVADLRDLLRPSVSETLSDARLAEIQAALDAIPAPPWHWIGDTKHQGPMLATKHSGWIYVMGFKRLGMRGAQPTFPVRGDDGYLLIKPCREIEERDSAAAKDVAIPRAPYDPDTVRGIDNPVALWLEHSAQYAKELLGEVDRLKAELAIHAAAMGDLLDELAAREAGS